MDAMEEHRNRVSVVGEQHLLACGSLPCFSVCSVLPIIVIVREGAEVFQFYDLL